MLAASCHLLERDGSNVMIIVPHNILEKHGTVSVNESAAGVSGSKATERRGQNEQA
jgi:hypothetical protein